MNRRVALVVTGRLEYLGLPGALRRLFPGAEIFLARSQDEADLRDSTSWTVDPAANQAAAQRALADENEAPPVIDELMTHVAGNLCQRDAPILSVLIEDLELANRGNEANVVRAVREAAVRHLAKMGTRRDAPRDLDERLRERASFHLFDPMVEAYFYEDPAALSIAQEGALQPAHRIQGRDPEQFEVDRALEGPYFAAVADCVRHRRPKDRKCPWDGAQRGQHPKKYLKYLCREAPPYQYCSTYRETGGGARALEALDWDAVLAKPGSAPFLRALVEDMADALGVAPAISGWPAAPTSTAPTALWKAPSKRVLRNL